MNIKELHALFLKYPIVSTDSRVIKKNSLFFALKGLNFDGNLYAENALSKGCTYAIIDNKAFKKNDSYIVVGNVLQTLQELAHYHRRYLNTPIIGITGTNGKTTTKELIFAVLNTTYKTICTEGNLNNHIGVPLTLLRLTKNTEMAIVEMGANHRNDINILCKIAEPDFGIITNIGKAHLQGFGSYEGVKKTKKELFDYILSTNGTIFINSDDKTLLDISEGIDSVDYGKSSTATCYGTIKRNSLLLSMTCNVADNAIDIHSHLFGDYNSFNILAAVCVGNYFNVSLEIIKQAIESYTPTNNRSQLIKTNTNTLFLDAYNANPTSMQLAIENFSRLAVDNKVLVLGEMFELGDEHSIEHKKIIDLTKGLDISGIYFIGNWGEESDKNFSDTQAFIDFLKENRIDNANILIKGSRGIKLEQIVDYL